MIFVDPSTSLIFILEWNSLLWSSPWCWTAVRDYGRVSTCKSLRGLTVFSLHHCPCCSSLPQNGGWLRNKQICLVARSLSRWKPESINFTAHPRALWTRLLNTERPACWCLCTAWPQTFSPSHHKVRSLWRLGLGTKCIPKCEAILILWEGCSLFDKVWFLLWQRLVGVLVMRLSRSGRPSPRERLWRTEKNSINIWL